MPETRLTWTYGAPDEPALLLPTSPTRPRSPVVRRLGHGLGMLPAAVGDLVLLLRGDPGRVAERQRRRVRDRLGSPVAVGTGPVGPGRVAAQALLSAPLGLVAWLLVAVTALITTRGPFYGFVDHGPYDHSWGGPSLAGAWLAHAGVWLATLPVLFLLGAGLVALHARLTAHLLGPDRRPWVLPVVGLIAAGAVTFVVAWSHQI